MTMLKSFKATMEQEQAIDLFKTGESLKINAFAGSGKTSTLKFLADTSTHSGLYLAFNRTLADEAKLKFPYWVTCKTSHSIAYSFIQTKYKYTKDKMFGTMNSNRIAEVLYLESLNLNSNIELTPRQCASLILETVRKYMQSDDENIDVKHVPEWGCLKLQNIESLKRIIVNYANTLWELMVDAKSVIPLGHDGYFKLWALSHPTIPVNYVLLDEAQDTAPVMLGVLKKQECQIVLVGDKYQQIYEWRGAINAMDTLKTDNEASLTQSFRFGDSIAEAATKLLSLLGELKCIKGNSSIISKLQCHDPNAILCRTNAGVVDYTIKCLEGGVTPHILGGNGEIIRFLTAVNRLKSGEHTEIPEFFGFTSWSEIISYSKTEEGGNLKTLVKIVEKYGVDKLLATLGKMNASEQDSNLIVSTVHRAKGRQWDKILVVDDFSLTENGEYNKSELNLLYVAMTRARREVQLPFIIMSLLGVK